MAKHLKGGPFEGTAVNGTQEDNLWITLYTLNGKLWTPPNGMFYNSFPSGVVRHGYRKQKDGQFLYAWSRPSGD